MKTFIPKENDIQRKRWLVVDATGQRLGRLATRVAILLRGKHKPIFTPHLDTGDFVIVINADKLVLTGDKLEQKQYFRHSTYPGGGKFTPVKKVMEQNPEIVVRKAIWGMIPHNALGRQVITKLKIYRGPDHPHEAQQPVEWDLDRK